jgi:hypothetical protein
MKSENVPQQNRNSASKHTWDGIPISVGRVSNRFSFQFLASPRLNVPRRGTVNCQNKKIVPQADRAPIPTTNV